MKQLYSLFLASVCLLASHMSRAQLCQDNINTVTTQWNSPASNNTWNWTAQFFTDAYIKNRPQPTTIASPFYSPNSTLQNQNIIFLQNAAVKDCQPIDGWELLVKDLGSGVALPATAVTNPFFALYNRYTATIRVFFLVTDPITATNNGATVSLQFEKTGQRASALLAHAESIMPAVDRFTKDISMRVPNRYTNESDFWMFADFPVAYDPCTCMFSSRLRFTFELIQSTDANLAIKLDGTGYIKQVIKSNAGVNVNGSDFPVFNWVNGLISSGTKGYNTYANFASGAAAINGFNNSLNPGAAAADLNAFTNIMRLGNSIPYLGGMMGIFDFLLAGEGRSLNQLPQWHLRQTLSST
ncbi:hypothetical protein ACFQT0_26270 [Hymenobacter humi]|uniref:Uncharacterized protein n=1 Tax=Hymenobacter humi TaxID=1411620 RepID=A0ABW2UC67_9BACT